MRKKNPTLSVASLRLHPRPVVDIGGNRIALIRPSFLEGLKAIGAPGAEWKDGGLILDESRLVIRVEPDGWFAEAL